MDNEIEENQSKEVITFKSLVKNFLFKFKRLQSNDDFLGSS
jgi:hypothetical protein